MIRQGDILLVPLDASVKLDLKNPVERDELGRIVLAKGEVTGHHHVVRHPGATLYAVEENLKVLDVPEPAVFEHLTPTNAPTLDHDPVKIAPGRWQVIQQRENTALGWQVVTD